MDEIRQKRKAMTGQLIRAARRSKGLSQMKLAERIGVTYQQVQKYESGKDDIPFSRIYDIAEALKIPVSNLLITEESPNLERVEEVPGIYGALNMQEKRLINLFRKVKDRQKRALVLKLLEALKE